MNKVNSGMKVVKAYTPVPDAIWISFEVIVDTTPVLADFVPRGIAMLFFTHGDRIVTTIGSIYQM